MGNLIALLGNFLVSGWKKLSAFASIYLGNLRAVTFPLLAGYFFLLSPQGQELFQFYRELENGGIWYLIVAIFTMAMWVGATFVTSYRNLQNCQNSNATDNGKFPFAKRIGISTVMAVLVLTVVVTSFVLGWLTTNETTVSSGSEFIRNILLTLIVFSLFWSFLNWYLPNIRYDRLSNYREYRRKNIGANKNTAFFQNRLIRALQTIIPIAAFFVLALMFSRNQNLISPSLVSSGLASKYFGSFGILFLFLAFVVYLIGKLTFYADRHKFPYTFLFFLWLITGSAFTSEHYVQFKAQNTDDTGATLAKPLPNFGEIVNAFDARNGNGVVANRVTYIVAAAGGGIRAAYYTAAVLRELCLQTKGDDALNFEKNTLAISSVSGGTLGAAIHVLNSEHLKSDDGCVDPKSNKNQTPTFADALEKDFLADALSGMFFSEVAKKLYIFGWGNNKKVITDPGAHNDGSPFFDRGKILGDSWLNSWKEIDNDSSFSFFDIFNPLDTSAVLQPDFPLLFSNSTDAITGKRVVASSVKTSDFLTDAIDFFDIASGNDGKPWQIDLSQVVLNSARFSYISPSGTVKNDRDDPSSASLVRLVDGGYFENFGAATALEIAQEYQKITKNPDRRLVLIQISNDASVFDPYDDNPGSASCKNNILKNQDTTKLGDGPRFLFEISTPIKAIFQTRIARGAYATKEMRCLADSIPDNKGKYFHIDFDTNTKAPLGWTISSKTREILDELAAKKVRQVISCLKNEIDCTFNKN